MEKEVLILQHDQTEASLRLENEQIQKAIDANSAGSVEKVGVGIMNRPNVDVSILRRSTYSCHHFALSSKRCTKLWM